MRYNVNNCLLESEQMLEDEINYETILDCMECVEELFKLCHDVNDSETIILEESDKDTIAQLSGFFVKVHQMFLLLQSDQYVTKCVGRPKLLIPRESLEELRALEMSLNKVARMFGVSRDTIRRRIEEHGPPILSEYSDILDEEIDNILGDWNFRHGRCTGELCSIRKTGFLIITKNIVIRKRIKSGLTNSALYVKKQLKLKNYLTYRTWEIK